VAAVRLRGAMTETFEDWQLAFNVDGPAYAVG
jgi:hypothetical protein